jgi:AraC-like DNA-binding protein
MILIFHIDGHPEARRLSKSHRGAAGTLSRLFHNEIGMGLTVWRNQLRLHRATLLLAEGRTVTHVSTACGLSSLSAFHAAFGRTPGSLYR